MAAGIFLIFAGSFPVGLRAASIIFPETSTEIGNIWNSHLFAYLCHLHVGRAQKIFCLLHAHDTDEAVQIHAGFLFENKAEITG